jgi:acylphosphatase
MISRHLIIKGKVQGVFYRASAKDTAKALGVKGWIKNTQVGNVEALVTGTDDQVNAFIEWCRKGPPDAVVKDIIVTDNEASGFADFRIVR